MEMLKKDADSLEPIQSQRKTVVKKIKLVHDNTEQIEGKINDQTIVILTKFVKKSL